MNKDTMKIQLPPPPRVESRRSKKGGWIAFAVLALVVALGGGFLAGSKWSSEKRADTANQNPTVENDQAENVDALMAEAKIAVADGEWIAARDLFQKILNREPDHAEATISKTIVDRHLDSARGGLKVVASPKGATVKVGEQLSGKSPFETEDLPLGKYAVTITMPGYETVKKTVSIAENKTAEITGVVLEKSSGSLDVVSVPVGADYKIVKDTAPGEQPKEFIKIGKTPAKLDELEAGNYKVVIEKEGWPSFSEKIRVEHNRAASVSAVFAKKSLNVTSDPAGAEIWVRLEGKKDFVKNGETPIALEDLPLGVHQIEARYSDWAPIRRTVKLLPDATPEPMDLQWKRSMVKLVSDPPGAEIYHLNRRLGNGRDVTPFLVELPTGDYKLTAIHKDLDSVQSEVLVTGDENGSLETDFQFEYGSVFIKTDPAGAGIIANGRPVGVTPKLLPYLRPGSYTFDLNKTDHNSGNVSAEVEPGGTVKLETKLKFDPTPKRNTNFTNSYGDKFVWVASLGGWVGVHEVTQKTYRSVMGKNPSQFEDDAKPVDSVSWYDANKFCEKININENSRRALPDGYVYKLPTDKQWSIFAGEATLAQAVTSKFARRDGTAKVGSLPANEFGIHDVRGNVWEWCQDWYSPTVMDRIRKDGAVATASWSGTERKVLRGGSWSRSADSDLHPGYRLAARQSNADRYDVGFRIVLMPDR